MMKIPHPVGLRIGVAENLRVTHAVDGAEHFIQTVARDGDPRVVAVIAVFAPSWIRPIRLDPATVGQAHARIVPLGATVALLPVIGPDGRGAVAVKVCIPLAPRVVAHPLPAAIRRARLGAVARDRADAAMTLLAVAL